jgi:nucleoside-diphosphate-sugar epimerase
MTKLISLKSTETISSAFKKIKGKFGQTLFIVDSKKKFLGTISEGDLRRCILEGKSLKAKVSQVMNKKPMFLFNNELNTKPSKRISINLGKTMDRPLVIPIINKRKKLLSAISTEKYFNNIKKKLDKNVKKNAPNVLIVGGAGYIGSNLTLRLLKKGYKVKVLDNFLYEKNVFKNFKKNKNLQIVKKDIANINVQYNILKKIDAVIYLAEIVGDPACAAKPQEAIKTNYIALNSLATLCSYMNINRFIYTSSCSVYGASSEENKVLTEQSPLNPVSLYARIKILSEKSLLSQSNILFSPTILRLGTVYGSSIRNRFDLVLNIFAKDAFFKGKINIFGGNQWRPNIHVDDVASAIIKALEAPLNKVERQIFNLSNSKENLRIKDLALKVGKIFNKCKILISKVNQDNRNYKVSSKKIEKILDFKPKHSIESSLKNFKKIFKRKKITNPNMRKFNNFKSLKNAS